MKQVRAALLTLLLTAMALVLNESVPAHAGSCAGFTLSCENGRGYMLCPVAVSQAGDVVSANLWLSPKRAIHVRLEPMGVGYRYIAPATQLDGVDNAALLKFGRNRSVLCTVSAR